MIGQWHKELAPRSNADREKNDSGSTMVLDLRAIPSQSDRRKSTSPRVAEPRRTCMFGMPHGSNAAAHEPSGTSTKRYRTSF